MCVAIPVAFLRGVVMAEVTVIVTSVDGSSL
jgi:hypothetical protein